VLRSADHFTLAHGVCVVVELADEAAALASLAPAEQHRARELAPVRRSEYVAGRTALRIALAATPPTRSAPGGSTIAADAPWTAGAVTIAPGVVAQLPPILSDDRGAPILPVGWIGSVSHKGAAAAALIAPAGAARIGIDLERAVPPRMDIGRRILTAREQAALPDHGRAVTLRFAIKEAIYKAIDPYVRRYVGFTEVELDITGNTVTVTTQLPLSIEATWREHAGHWLATARATLINA
jgi:enterobactin synthetase component D